MEPPIRSGDPGLVAYGPNGSDLMAERREITEAETLTVSALVAQTREDWQMPSCRKNKRKHPEVMKATK